jgi:hypothetical protein
VGLWVSLVVAVLGGGFYGSVWELLGRCCVLVGFGFLGFPFGVLLFTSCILGLRPFAFLTYKCVHIFG